MAKRAPVKPRVALDLVVLVIRPAGTVAPHDGAEEKTRHGCAENARHQVHPQKLSRSVGRAF
jgi:hypothetical protein